MAIGKQSFAYTPRTVVGTLEDLALRRIPHASGVGWRMHGFYATGHPKTGMRNTIQLLLFIDISPW